MLAWHLAGTLFLFRWIFRDPKVDLRFLLGGALLPDLIDLPIGTLVLAERYSSGELWTHSLLAPTAIGILILIVTRRGPTRKQWLAMVIGMMFHLLLDGMWTDTRVFLWPFAGPLQVGSPGFWAGAVDRALGDPWRWLREFAGITYLYVVTKPSGLVASTRSVWRTGHLPEPAR